MEAIFGSLSHQYYKMLRAIHQHDNNRIKVGALGPSGTSSENAAKFLLKNMKEFEPQKQYELVVFDTFSELLHAACSKEVHFALVPSASDKITNFFWERCLENCLTFLHTTPGYALVGMPSFEPRQGMEITIATCTAVEHMIERFCRHELRGMKIKKMITPSTTKALEVLLEGKASLAITNETSIQKYHASVSYVSDIQYAQIVWCLFRFKIGGENQYGIPC